VFDARGDELATDKPSWLIGYARVSTSDQNLDLQINALKEAGVSDDRIFTDKMSGARSDRPGLKACFRALDEGDTLVVWKLDRLGRSVRGIVETLEQLKLQKVELRVLTEAIDTRTPTGKFTLHILAAMAQMERDLIIERTLAGQKAARERGVTMGRPATMTPTRAKKAEKLLANGWSKKRVGDEIGVSRATIYNWLDRKKKKSNK